MSCYTSAEVKAGVKLSRREAIRLGALWKVAIEMGMAQREIVCLQDGHSRGELATMFNLSPGRISQIKAKAIRKMRHPWRVRLAIELGLTEKLGLTKEEFDRANARSLEEEIARYRNQKGIVPAADDEE